MTEKPPPVGWYSRADGTKQYWDGSDWLVPDDGPHEVQHEGPNPIVDRPSRKRLLIGIGAVIVLCGGLALVLALTAGTSSTISGGPQAVPSPSVAPTIPSETPTPIEEPTVPVTYEDVDEQTWREIMAAPGLHSGKAVRLYGKIVRNFGCELPQGAGAPTTPTSFTGAKWTRKPMPIFGGCAPVYQADVSNALPTSLDEGFTGQNAILISNPERGAWVGPSYLRAGDIFAANARLSGLAVYTTEVGEKGTVPKITLDRVEAIVRCDPSQSAC